jgi:dolichol-phosphate mannosyltransferase
LISAVYSYYILNANVPGWTTLVVLITFLFGILFIVLGVIGEYIGRILIETRNRPRYIIDDSIGTLTDRTMTKNEINKGELKLSR